MSYEADIAKAVGTHQALTRPLFQGADLTMVPNIKGDVIELRVRKLKAPVHYREVQDYFSKLSETLNVKNIAAKATIEITQDGEKKIDDAQHFVDLLKARAEFNKGLKGFEASSDVSVSLRDQDAIIVLTLPNTHDTLLAIKALTRDYVQDKLEQDFSASRARWEKLTDYLGEHEGRKLLKEVTGIDPSKQSHIA